MHDRHQTPAETPTEDELLASVSRAALHDPRGRNRAPIWALLEHLDIPRRSSRARAIRPLLATLERRGWLERGSAHGVPMWSLTASGVRHLKRVERARGQTPLPESPQHRTWRQAHLLAEQEIERFAEQLQEAVLEAERLLRTEREEAIAADAWLELGARFARDCRLLASARHCLSDWPEPDETRADVDTLSGAGDEHLDHDRLRALRVLRAGRRNTLLWREPD